VRLPGCCCPGEEAEEAEEAEEVEEAEEGEEVEEAEEGEEAPRYAHPNMGTVAAANASNGRPAT